MAEACRDRRGPLAAEALGTLGNNERIALLAHLEGCDACRTELDDLRRVARLLPLADVDRLPETPDPPSNLGDRVVATVRAARRTRARRRVGGAVAALAVAAVAAVALAIGLQDGGNGSREVEMALQGDRASGAVVLVERAWGTEIHLDARDLDAREVYWLWLTGDEDDAGERRVSAGTFGGGDDITVVLAAALPFEDTRRVWVTDDTDAVVLDGWR